MGLTLNKFYPSTPGSINFTAYAQENSSLAKGNGGNSTSFCFISTTGSTTEPLNLSDAWNQGEGFFVFFPFDESISWTPTNQKALAEKLYGYWIRNGKGQLFSWFDLSWDSTTSTIVLPPSPTAQISTLNGNVVAGYGFNFRQFQLRFPATSQWSISVNSKGKKINFETTDHSNFIFDTNQFDSSSETQLDIGTKMSVGISDARQGGVKFNISACVEHFELLKAGFHYYHDSSTTGASNYEAFTFPLLDPETGDAPLKCTLNPLMPTNASQSLFKVSGKNNLATNLTTVMGNSVQLKAKPESNEQGDPSGFGLVNYPSGNQETGLYCLTMQGTFALICTAAPSDVYDGEHQLLCGLSGTEHIGFSDIDSDSPGDYTDADLIDFIPGKPAWVPTFPVLKPKPGSANPSAKLDLVVERENFTTSWVQIRSEHTGGYGGNYYSQPITSSLFTGTNETGSQFLSVFPAISGNTHNYGYTMCFPMVPYANATAPSSYPDSDTTLTEFEFQILNPTRKKLIITDESLETVENLYKAAAKTHPVHTTLTTSPQGFLVEVEEANEIQNWADIRFGTTKNPAVAADKDFHIANPSYIVQSAFKTNQQFLVATKADSLGKLAAEAGPAGSPTFHNTISIANWPFHINIGETSFGDYSNVFISKFCKGSLIDRIQNVKSWTMPEHFIGTDKFTQGQVSGWLQNYCQKIINSYEKEGNVAFENIYNILHDKEWNGIVVFNVDIGVNDFPEELKGLLGGIDMSRFKANHFGIEVNHISVDKDTGVLSDTITSSLFGLIDYVDPEYAKGKIPPGKTDVDYDFKVLKLEVLFENSGISNFASELQLTMNQLYGDQVTNLYKDPYYNTILLKGTYENHNGQNTYMFTEDSSQANSEGALVHLSNPRRFTLASNVLGYVEVLKVQFKTTSTQQSSNDVTTRFSIWGNLHFEELAEIDVFSFDDLSIADLGITMDFDDTNPAATRVFAFDATAQTFDISTSKGRPGGFALNFPLALSGFVIGSAAKMPESLGYLPVQSPISGGQELSGDWYALKFDLNLGTLGALAGKADLTSNIIVAWSPGADSSNHGFAADVFIHLPGSGGSSSLFSLQGIVKLTIQDIQLFATTDTSKHTTEYVMKFTDLALKILSLKFPPTGSTGMLLFGNPAQAKAITTDPSQSSLGWYAAYNNDN